MIEDFLKSLTLEELLSLSELCDEMREFEEDIYIAEEISMM